MKVNYLRQAVARARSERLYTGLYLTGVALAVATVMTLSVILYSRLAPVYPEYKRGRQMYVTSMLVKLNFGGDMWGSISGQLSYKNVMEWLVPLKGAEMVTMINEVSKGEVNLPGSKDVTEFRTYFVDGNFFRIYEYDVLAGNLFTEADIENHSRVAVISDRVARKYFGNADAAVGETLQINFSSYRVKGVVRGAGLATPDSYADVFLPFTCKADYDAKGYYQYTTVILRKEDVSEEALRDEFTALVSATNAANSAGGEKGDSCAVFNQPFNHYNHTFFPFPADEEKQPRKLGYYLIIAAVLLLVPALNLSGLIMGSMDRRVAEMGVRKSFGARPSALLRQVLAENLMLTLAGAFIGLIVSWIIVYFNADVLFSIVDGGSATGRPMEISSMFSPWVFLITLAVTLILNTLSSFIPAVVSLRRPIVQSINEGR